jgi:CHAT domain-containing protein/tetratricopeptide (TPR) repeat protein
MLTEILWFLGIIGVGIGLLAYVSKKMSRQDDDKTPPHSDSSDALNASTHNVLHEKGVELHTQRQAKSPPAVDAHRRAFDIPRNSVNAEHVEPGSEQRLFNEIGHQLAWGRGGNAFISYDVARLLEQGGHFNRQGKYTEAEVLFEQALDLCERILGGDHPDTMIPLNSLAEVYIDQGRYREAEPLLDRALEVRTRLLGRDHPDTLMSTSNMAALYQMQGRYDDAIALSRMVLEARERVLGKDHSQTLISVNNLGSLLDDLGRFTEAESFCQRAFESSERLLGWNHELTRASANNLGMAFLKQGRHADAMPVFERTMQECERAVGPDHPDTMRALSSLASLLTDQGRYGEARPLIERALQFREQRFGKDHPDTLISVNALASLYENLGQYAAAGPLFVRVLEVRERLLGSDHPLTISSVNNLSAVYYHQARYGEAETLSQRALDARERVLGKDHPDTLDSVSNLASLFETQGRYNKAEVLFKLALEARERVLGKDHPDTVISANNLAGVYVKQGRYGEAEPLHVRAAEASEQVLGKDHPNSLMSLNDLAGLYVRQGRYNEAEPLFERAVEAKERLLGRDHPATLTSVNNLANVYQHQGRYSDAEPLYERVIEASERVHGRDHPTTLAYVNNLAELYHDQAKYSDAEALHARALEACKRALGEEHPQTLASRYNLAGLYRAQDRYAEAEQLYEQTLESCMRVLGGNHPQTLSSIAELASLYWRDGRYREAEPLLERVLKARERLLGTDHPSTQAALSNWATFHAVDHRPNEAFELFERGLRAESRLLLERLRNSSPQEALTLLRQGQNLFHGFLSLVRSEFLDSGEHVRKAADLVLRRKAMGLETLRSQRSTLLSNRYPNLALQIRDCTNLRMRVVTKTLVGPTEGELPERHAETLVEWMTQLEKLEKQLSRDIPELETDEEVRVVDSMTVSLALPPGATLIEFLRFNIFSFSGLENDWKPAHYAAFVIRSGQSNAVRMVDLGEASAVERIVFDFRRSVVEADLRAIQEFGDQLRIILDPVLPAGAGRLYLGTDGELSLLPFDALPGSQGRFLIDDYEISYLGCGRDLLRPKKASPVKATGPLVLADPNFDLTATGTSEDRLSSSLGRELEDEKIRFTPLPGTRVEGERIGRLLSVDPWFGDRVLEGSVKRQQSPSLVHIATHGFFLADPASWRVVDLDRRGVTAIVSLVRGPQTGPLRGPGMGNPMLRSGLALAGSQSWMEGKPTPLDAEDGLLTAEDAAEMDLRATELVVLSACDTGMGEVRHGEGVFGLRRAFIAAGAKTLVMSLWKVDDLATLLLMERFYQNLLERKMGRAAALHDAQLYLRRDAKVGVIRDEWLNDNSIDRLSHGNSAQRTRMEHWRSQPNDYRPFREPRFWAAFILHGEAGPLPESCLRSGEARRTPAGL